jgi:hypothetical protein
MATRHFYCRKANAEVIPAGPLFLTDHNLILQYKDQRFVSRAERANDRDFVY